MLECAAVPTQKQQKLLDFKNESRRGIPAPSPERKSRKKWNLWPNSEPFQLAEEAERRAALELRFGGGDRVRNQSRDWVRAEQSGDAVLHER